jgi:hypothetical protein
MILSGNGKPLEEIGLKKALELMRKPETRLVKCSPTRAAKASRITSYLVA